MNQASLVKLTTIDREGKSIIEKISKTIKKDLEKKFKAETTFSDKLVL